MHEIDEQLYRDCLRRLIRGGPVRLTTCRNHDGMIPHVILEWLIAEGDAEQFTAADGREWVRVKETEKVV